jgi:uncharacterized protein YyaL (SSP411 family)
MNRLSRESSPYLLQHANNPVDWYPWGDEALTKARTENKPILVSIGYSACHWCHVMEHECFEKDNVAAVMNAHYVCIKVDREERPDVDAVYMDALQAMGTRGGWPLNVFLLPDARPFYGVTYLPEQNWIQLLNSVKNAFDNHYNDLADSAEGFVKNMVQSESEKYGLTGHVKNASTDILEQMFQNLRQHFDTTKGGMNRAPKFPMPSIYKFLMRYYDLTQNPEALAQIALSLDRIALGGIYDHIGGGWARYSVDEDWFIPHFEKMLYDNGQLLSVFAEAYMLTHSPLYLQRIKQTVSWLHEEMLSPEGGFYSALDADSEGVEGKFYVWTEAEIKEVLGSDYPWFSKLYKISKRGNWEHGLNHLHLTEDVLATAKANSIDTADIEARYTEAIERLSAHRELRVRPGLDDKILASWNGLLVKGLADSYCASGDESIRSLAVQAGTFLADRMVSGGKLSHNYKNGIASITGFLEDYATVSEAFLSLYQITFDEHWLTYAQQLIDYAIANFFDEADGFFFFTDAQGEVLIARKKELFDNVIPASNSIMASNLYALGKILDRDDYLDRSEQMLSKMQKIMTTDVQWVTNWAALFCQHVSPTAEIVIVGEDADAIRKDLHRFYVPNKVILGTTEASNLPLLKYKTDFNRKTAIYVCYNKTCQLPVTEVESALEQLSMS